MSISFPTLLALSFWLAVLAYLFSALVFSALLFSALLFSALCSAPDVSLA
jgi:hypothetical protein